MIGALVNGKFWRYAAAFLIPAIFVLLYRNTLDNDSWFVLAEGKYLVENGIHYVDVLTIHEGMNLVVQNYAFCMVFYVIYSMFGAFGVYTLMLVLNFIICFLIYKICMLLSNKNVNLSLLIMVVTDLLLAMVFVTTRAQMISYVTFLSVIYVLELYIKTDKIKYLWFIPFFSLIEINFHGAYWWIIFLVLGVYLVDSIKKPKLHLQGYRTKPLIFVGAISLLVGLINPYGVRMITYIFTSYGAPEITGLVVEMRSFNFQSFFNAVLYIAIVLVGILYLFGNKRRIRMRYVLMFLGFLGLGLNAIKGMSQFILVMFLPLALMYKDTRIGRIIEAKISRNALMFWSGVVAVLVFVGGYTAMACSGLKDGPDGDGIIQAMDVIEEVSGGDKNSRIYVGYNNGGYVEYRGYKAYMDPRAEVFLKENNGKENILEEWEKWTAGKVKMDDFLNKYDFDYLIADNYSDYLLYSMDNEEYEVIYENEEEEIKVFKKNA